MRPIACFQVERSELHVDGHDVLPCRRECGIEDCRNRNIEIGRGRKFAVFGGVESAFEIVDAWADVDAAAQRGAISGLLERGEGGQAVEREIQFCGGSLRAEMLHLNDEAWRQVNRVEKAKQSTSRV